jgi:ABC-type transport system involved in multi-copper enzyme maturation permease subunit
MARLNPFVAITLCLSPFQMAVVGGIEAVGCDFLLIAVGVYVGCLVLASLLLRRDAATATGESSGPPRRSFRFFLRWLGNDLVLRFHPARLLDSRGQLGANPIVWKNAGLAHDPVKAAFHRLVVLFGLLAGGLALWLLAKGEDAPCHREFWVALFGISLPFGLVLTALLAATSFARERQAGTLELLLTTSFRSRDIVWGTAVSLLRSSAFFWLLPLAFLLVALAVDGESVWTIVVPMTLILVLAAVLIHVIGSLAGAGTWRWRLVWLFLPAGFASIAFISALALDDLPKPFFFLPLACLVVLYALFVITVGMFISVLVKTTARAVVLTLLVVAVVAAGIPIASSLVALASQVAYTGDDMAFAVLSFSPSFWLVVTSGGELHWALWGHGPGWPFLIIHLVLYAGAIMVGLANLAWGFDAYVGRQPGGTSASPAPNDQHGPHIVR